MKKFKFKMQFSKFKSFNDQLKVYEFVIEKFLKYNGTHFLESLSRCI